MRLGNLYIQKKYISLKINVKQIKNFKNNYGITKLIIYTIINSKKNTQ